jgi:hypothetical protein
MPRREVMSQERKAEQLGFPYKITNVAGCTREVDGYTLQQFSKVRNDPQADSIWISDREGKEKNPEQSAWIVQDRNGNPSDNRHINEARGGPQRVEASPEGGLNPREQRDMEHGKGELDDVHSGSSATKRPGKDFLQRQKAS